MPGSLSLSIIHSSDNASHSYRVYEPQDASWLTTLASEYVALRTACSNPIPSGLADGIDVLDMTAVMSHIRASTIPMRRQGNFDVVRSDFGEVILYQILEQLYGTKIAIKSVRDRELISLPGRGIDVVGIEESGLLTLVICEAKVSNEAISPPRVVDRNDDCLRNQHLAHLQNAGATKAKIWDIARKADSTLRGLYWRAALYFQNNDWDKLRLVTCCGLVRPRDKYQAQDFGSFAGAPGDYSPSDVRFLIFCVPGDDIDPTVTAFHSLAMTGES